MAADMRRGAGRYHRIGLVWLDRFSVKNIPGHSAAMRLFVQRVDEGCPHQSTRRARSLPASVGFHPRPFRRADGVVVDALGQTAKCAG